MTNVRSFVKVRSRLALGLGVLSCVWACAPGASAQDDWVARANALYAPIREANRSDLIILPAVAAMDEPPADFAQFKPSKFTDASAVLSWDPPARDDWAEVDAWLMAPAQRAVIEALARVTDNEDLETHMAFAQPYGVEAVASSFELVEKGYYTELSDPPSLAAARFGYLKAIDRVMLVGWLETFRLVNEGDPLQAIEVAIDMGLFARQIADRGLAAEVRYGIGASTFAVARVREIAYEDAVSERPALTPAGLGDIVKRLDPETSAGTTDRIEWPEASEFAAKQLVVQTYQRGGQPDEERFAIGLARVDVTDFPLRVFSESAKYDKFVGEQVDWYTINQVVEGVYKDLETRWELGPTSPLLAVPPQYDKLGTDKMVARVAFANEKELVDARQWLKTELAGTRMALALQAYVLRHRLQPPKITAPRPDYVEDVIKDPYSRYGRDDLQFFVPVRDTPKGVQGVDKPYEIRVYALDDTIGVFSLNLLGDTFALYSVGPDGRRGMLKDVVQGDASFLEGDYILWPPYTSLVRKFMKDAGRIP